MRYRTLLLSMVAALLAAASPLSLLAGGATAAPAAPKQDAPKPDAAKEDPLAVIAAKLKADEGGLATALSEDLIKQIELRSPSKYPANKEGNLRRQRDVDTVLQDIKSGSDWWAGYVVLEQKSSRGQLTADEKKKMAEFLAALDRNLGDEKTAMKIDQVGTKKAIDSLRSQIDPSIIATKEGQDKLYERYGLGQGVPGVGATPLAGGPKDKIVSESQIIRQFEPGDPYLYKDGAFMITSKAGHPLALQMRGGYDNPKGAYGYLADVNDNRDIRGITFELYNGSEKTVELHGEVYKISVVSAKVDGRDDLVVHVYPVDAKGGTLKKKVKEGDKETQVEDELTAETIKVYGTDGLMEKAVRKAVDGHDNGDGSKERYVAWLGEGDARRKFYVVPQGGAKAGATYYDAEKLDRAYDAIVNRKTFSESLMRPTHVFAVSESKNGQATPLDAANATVVEYAGTYYQYQWNEVSGAMEIKKVTKPSPRPAPAGDGAAAPAADGTTQVAPGAPGTAPAANGEPGVDPDYPARLRGPVETETEKRHYTAKQHAINAKLKTLVDYRIYASDKNAYFVIPAAIKDALIPQSQMDGARMPAPESAEGTLTMFIVDDTFALIADTPEVAFLFKGAAPLTVKDLPKADNGTPDMSKVDMVFHKAGAGNDTTFRVSSLQMLQPALSLRKFNQEDGKKIYDRAKEAISKGQLKSIQGTGSDKGERIFVSLAGKPAMIIWPKVGAAPAGGKPDEEAGGETAAPTTGAKPPEPSYHMPDTPLTFRAAAPGVMEEKLEIDGVDGKKIALHRDFEDKMKHVAVYCNKEVCPKNKKDAVWYVRWHPMKTKSGKTLAKAQYPADFELAGQASAPKEFPYRDGMGFNPLVVEDAEDIGHVIMRSDPKPGHENAYAFFLNPYDDNHKHEMFLGHAMYKGVEPKSSDHK